MSELTVFKFPDSGVEVNIRKVSPLLALEVQRSIEKPQPPMETIVLASGETSQEANNSHPDYQKALEAYNIAIEEKTKKLIISRGVVITLTAEMKAEVKELREYMKTELGLKAGLNDKEFYISYIAIASGKDFQALIETVLGASQPTQEAVDQAKDSFPS